MARTAPLLPDDAPGPGLRLRTLVLLRWLAVIGQAAAVIVAQAVFGIDVPVLSCAAVIALSVAVNLASIASYPAGYRLGPREAVLVLLFDLAQLGLLLALTGGLHNPFALLILAPVTVAATALATRSAILMGLATIAIVTALSLWHQPLGLPDGAALTMPPILTMGTWTALVIGVMFLAGYARQVSNETRALSKAYLATQMALAREQNLTNLGGVVAAAAHELGTPLATIKLVTAEMLDELPDDCPHLRDDLQLLSRTADRCRDILRDMGKAGKDDLLLKTAPLTAILHEAAEPHAARGRELVYGVGAADGGPVGDVRIARRPEIIHGLRNLIQNAVDFSRQTVWIDAALEGGTIRLQIADDGNGYPTDLLGRIGEPFLRGRARSVDRGGYEGMGLGLFIAKSLLERTGARVQFGNGSARSETGAVAQVTWPRDVLEAGSGRSGALGENQPFRP